MASTASDLLKFEKQTTGENASTWGTKANTAMSRIEEAIAGYRAIAVAGSTYTLDDTQYSENSSTTSESHLSFIKCTGTPGASRLIAVPARTKHYTVWNAVTTYDITFGISGNTVVTVPTGHIVNVFCDGTNTYATSPLLNTTGQITYEKGGDISSASPTVIDTDGHMFDVTGTTNFSAFTVAAERLFVLQFDGVLTMTHGAGTLDLINGTNITTAAGDVGVFYSTAANVVRMISWTPATAKLNTIWVPASAMYPSTTNGCAALAQVETTALRPDLKCLDFDPSSDEFAQFSIAMPKSWNEGTITYRPYWTVTGTNTGTVAWQLGGVAMASDDTINAVFGTLVATTALAHSGTSNDLMVSATSGAVTIAGSPAAGELCFFQINRDVSADAQTGDARLLGIKIFYTTDTHTDT